jgi:hypothetical protein
MSRRRVARIFIDREGIRGWAKRIRCGPRRLAAVARNRRKAPSWQPGESGNLVGPQLGACRAPQTRPEGQRPERLTEVQLEQGVQAVLAAEQARLARRAESPRARAWVATQLRTPGGVLRLLELVAAAEETETAEPRRSRR